MVYLKLIPRIDYDRKRNRNLDDKVQPSEAMGKQKPRWKRPTATLFDQNKVSDRITMDGSYVIFENNRYDSAGFLRKEFRINAVVSLFSI